MSLYPSYGLPTLIKIPETSIKHHLPFLQIPHIDIIDFETRILPCCKFAELYDDGEDSDYPESEEMIDLGYTFINGLQIDFFEAPLVETNFCEYLESKLVLTLDDIDEEQYEQLQEPEITFNTLKLRSCSKFIEYPIDFDFIIQNNYFHSDITPNTIVLGDFADTPPSDYNIKNNMLKKEDSSMQKVSNKSNRLIQAQNSNNVSKINPNLKITFLETVEDVIRDKELTETSSLLSKSIISKEVKKKTDSKLFPEMSIKNEQNSKEMMSEEINNQMLSMKLSKEVKCTPKIVEQSESDKNQSSDDSILSNLHFSSDSDQNQTETNDESNLLHLFDTNHILQGKVVKKEVKKKTLKEKNTKNHDNSVKVNRNSSIHDRSVKTKLIYDKNISPSNNFHENSVKNVIKSEESVKNTMKYDDDVKNVIKSEESVKNMMKSDDDVKNSDKDLQVNNENDNEDYKKDGLHVISGKIISENNEIVKNHDIHDKNVDKTRKCFIADSSFSNDEMFNEVFDDCRVIYRKLSDHQFELDTKECVIINDINLKNVSNCLSVFDNVYLVSIGNCIDYKPFIGVGRVFVRRVSSKKDAFILIKSMSKPLEFDRIEETLHEYFLSLFPCVPRIVAMSWLMKGNPVSDPNCIPKYDVCSHMFQVVLDSKTFLQSKPRTKNPSVKRIEAYATQKSKISKK